MIFLVKLILYPIIVLLGGFAVFGYRTACKAFKKYRDVN